jgi:hypothetical protein
MTNQEAIRIIKNNWPGAWELELQEALALAIGLLKTGAKVV